MNPEHTAHLEAAAAALEAVDRAQRQWLACAIDLMAVQHGPPAYDVDRYAQVSDAEGEARLHLTAANNAATAALAALREAGKGLGPPSPGLEQIAPGVYRSRRPVAEIRADAAREEPR